MRQWPGQSSWSRRGPPAPSRTGALSQRLSAPETWTPPQSRTRTCSTGHTCLRLQGPQRGAPAPPGISGDLRPTQATEFLPSHLSGVLALASQPDSRTRSTGFWQVPSPVPPATWHDGLGNGPVLGPTPWILALRRPPPDPVGGAICGQAAPVPLVVPRGLWADALSVWVVCHRRPYLEDEAVGLVLGIHGRQPVLALRGDVYLVACERIAHFPELLDLCVKDFLQPLVSQLGTLHLLPQLWG